MRKKDNELLAEAYQQIFETQNPGSYGFSSPVMGKSIAGPHGSGTGRTKDDPYPEPSSFVDLFELAQDYAEKAAKRKSPVYFMHNNRLFVQGPEWDGGNSIRAQLKAYHPHGG